MTIARRIARLELALPPTEAVLVWLADAQAHGSLAGYATWLIDHAEQVHPLVRITEQVAASARAGLRGEDHDTVADAVRRAVGHATFLFALVPRIEVATDELVRVEGPRLAALGAWRRTAREGSQVRRALAADALGILDDHDRVRRRLEAQHLDARDALFADTAAAWADLLAQARDLAGALPPVATDEGRPPGAADIVAAARSDALDLLGRTLLAASTLALRVRGSA